MILLMIRCIELLMVFAIAFPAAAMPPEDLQPVDQAVGDLDPLSTSLRRVETGIRTSGQQTALYRLPLSQVSGENGPDRPGGTVYYRVAPGLTARVARLDYLVRVGRRGVGFNIKPRVDGEFFEVISANTIFELNPIQVTTGSDSSLISTPVVDPEGAVVSASLLPVDYRLPQQRIDLRVDTRLAPDDSQSRYVIPPDTNVIELYSRDRDRTDSASAPIEANDATGLED